MLPERLLAGSLLVFLLCIWAVYNRRIAERKRQRAADEAQENRARSAAA